MKRHLECMAIVMAVAFATQANAFVGPALFSENFDSLTLGNSVNERISTIPTFDLSERVASDPDYSPVPNAIASSLPTNWTVYNSGFTGFNVDLAYDPFAGGDPLVLDIEEGIAPPVGTVIGNNGLLNQGDFNNGVDEWEGWNVVDKNFWVTHAGDQQRSLWTGGVGNVAVADPDEYDDLGDGRGGGYYNSAFETPAITIPADETDLQLNFDYSFRAEAFDDGHDVPGSSILGLELNNSTAQVYVTYDGPNGSTQAVPGTLIDSDGGKGIVGDPDFRLPSATLATPATFDVNDVLIDAGDVDGSASVILPTIPAGATNVKIAFGLLNAGNDWWYAVDNIVVNGAVNAQLFSEDFETVTLTDSINEQKADVPDFALVTEPEATPDTNFLPNAFTKTTPANWNINNTNVPAVGNDDVGVFEWEGWSFSTVDFWNTVSGQDRDLFLKGEGNIAIADGDEWDDLGDPDSIASMDTLLETPVIDITGVAPGTLYLKFDSSWRQENLQTAVITVDYGNGQVEVLRWESENGDAAFFKDSNLSERVSIALNNPAGATSAKISFQYVGDNNWWWAIDDVSVGVVPEPTTMGLSMLGLIGLAAVRRRK